MKTLATNLYPSTLCDASMVAAMTEDGENIGYMTPPLEHCGYILINNRLVPEAFIQRVIEQLAGRQFQYGCVLSEADVFDAEFLASLDEQEQSVLMFVVLEIVARGDFELNLWAAYEQDLEGVPA
nr:hypothetical protein [uncultured Rhodoferax sp.]